MDHSDYTLDELSEYDNFFESNGVDKSIFIKHLNHITSPNSQLCDFNSMLSYVRDKNNYAFKYIISTLMDNEDPIYFRVWYLYFKFLLLDNDIKDIFYQECIRKLLSFNNIIFPTIKQSWDDILQEFYVLVNENEFLHNFMDSKDNYGQYIRLDISKISNIRYKCDEYMDHFVLELFHEVIVNYDNVQFCYNFIYCISDKYGYNKIDNSNGFIDFTQRFHSNIDKFIIVWNAMNITYYDIHCVPYSLPLSIEKKKELINNIPINEMAVINYYGSKISKVKIDNKYVVIKCLFEDIFMTLPKKFKNMQLYEKFIFYFESVIEYDFDNDQYKLIHFIRTKYEDNELKQIYTDFIKSDIVKGLHYMYTYIYLKLQDMNIDENLIELKNYIEKIFDKYNYQKLIPFDN